MGNHQAQAVQLDADSNPVTCPACHSGSFDRKPTGIEEFCLSICQQCYTACTFPRPKTDDLEVYYTSAYYGQQNKKFISPIERGVDWLNRLHARRLHRALQGPGKVLDVGCGRGSILEELSGLGHECFGIERSALAASRARQNLELRIYTCPLEDCGFIASSFDLVILWHVLEHLQDPNKTMGQIRDILKPGGLLVLEVPNFSSWQAKAFSKYWFHLDIPRHLFHFSQQGLTQLLKANGFTISGISTFSLPQGPFGAMQSTLNCLISPLDGLYGLLKGEIRISMWKKLIHVGLGGVLSFPALLYAGIETAFGRGAVLRVMAHKAW